MDRRCVQSFSFLGSLLYGHSQRGAHLECLAAFVDGQQIGDELARHCERRTVGVSAFQFAGMQRGQLRIPSRGQFGRFDEPIS